MSKKRSRTTYTIYNFITSIGGQFVSILMSFVVRTVFIHTLGKSYLGINGLFSNILSMLSLTELGLGTAILYNMYEPVQKEDHTRITVLMKFYKSAYRVIGIVIALLGLLLIPFLPVIISDYHKLEELNINAALIFMLFVFRTVSSYWFFAFKRAIIRVHQRGYMINMIGYLFTLGTSIVRILCLWLFPDFLLYVIISIIGIIGENIVCARMANKAYPYINDKIPDKLSREEMKHITKDCYALSIYKANKFVLKATDNIVLSAFLGIGAVGLYSNYYIFYTSINRLMSKVYDSATHSLGNLHVAVTKHHEYKVFKSFGLVTALMGGTIAVGITCVGDEFVRAWVGPDWVIPQPFSLLLGIELFTLASNKFMNRFRTIMGLFQQAKYRPVASMVINLVVSIALVQVWGIYGVLIGTIVANWSTMMWYDPLVIHRLGFENQFPVRGYFLQLAEYWLIVVVTGVIDYLICTHVFVGHGWFSVIFHILVCGVSVPLALWITQRKKEESQYVMQLAGKHLKKIPGLKKLGKKKG